MDTLLIQRAIRPQVEDLDGNVLRIGSESIPNCFHGEWHGMNRE